MLFSQKKLLSYPSSAGVYIMKDACGRVLYIGKAKNLKNRLKQYFSDHDSRATVPYLIKQVTEIETILVENEKEALILENNLIKKEKPKYNLLLKDDKTFVSLMITAHKWPAIKIVRIKKYPQQKTSSPAHYFGPYTNAKAARHILHLILKLFPLRQCSDSEFASRKRPCLLYDIKKCLAPCTGKCSQAEYQKHIKQASELLKGHNKKLLKELKGQMQVFSQKTEYEKAQNTLDLINRIKHICEIQNVENLAFANSDAIGYFTQKNEIIIAILSYREGRLIASEHFSFSFYLKNVEETLENFILQYYLKKKPPKTVFLPENLNNKKNIQAIISKTIKTKIKLNYPQKGLKLKAIKMANANAKSLFEREKKQKSLNEKWLLNLQDILKLSHFPQSILVFDASHLSETQRVAVLITFINGTKKLQKLFKIKTAKPGDINALKEVIFRYFSKLSAAENNQSQDQRIPNLLLLDGGKTHVTTALQVLKELKIATVDVIGLAKEQARHDKGLRKEKVFLAHAKQALLIDPSSPALFLLQKIRDEAHRAAISFYRRLKSKSLEKSLLDDIAGIGKIKKQKLLKHFKSLNQIKKASKEELQKVAKIQKKDAEKIHNFFRQFS